MEVIVICLAAWVMLGISGCWILKDDFGTAPIDYLYGALFGLFAWFVFVERLIDHWKESR